MAEGLKLLKRRAAVLGHELVAGGNENARIRLIRCDARRLGSLLKSSGAEPPLDAARQRQTYHLVAETTDAGTQCVTIEASADWGLYYGILTLCQLLDLDGTGVLRVPAIEIVDYPEIAHRLAKTMASNSPDLVSQFAGLLPLLKISQIGLHFSGQNSKAPRAEFTTNVKTLCPRLRRQGILESIVYFCPFRGEGPRGTPHPKGAYDLAIETDRQAYVDYLLWIMAQGAHGIEVDYNDWPGSPEVPISDVLNLACQAVKKRYPDAYILYCPPPDGGESYRGPAGSQLGQTLSKVPPSVWPLWTGTATVIRYPLKASVVEQWTRVAGRRPFLWLNRASVGVKESVSHRVPGTDGFVFAGERLPSNLNQLFEGVHLNTGSFGSIMLNSVQSQPQEELPKRLDARELVYLATVSDFLWNPHDWDPVDSYQRAVRFVEIVRPLLAEAASSQKAP